MPLNKESKSKAGHYEIQGETIAKFEFFENGFNPYSRYLDVDKVDLLLRKRIGDKIQYIEVQVKYGRLYKCSPKWQTDKFDYTSWRFFKLTEFGDTHSRLFVAYVLAHPDGYKGDIFIFPAKEFNQIINSALIRNTKQGKKANLFIAHSFKDDRWYVWKKWNFSEINPDTAIDVTRYRRNFQFS
jgi:hypothetical protein